MPHFFFTFQAMAKMIFLILGCFVFSCLAGGSALSGVGLVDYSHVGPMKECLLTYKTKVRYRESVAKDCMGMAALPLLPHHLKDLTPRIMRYFPLGEWIPLEPAFPRWSPGAMGTTFGHFLAPSQGKLFLLGRWDAETTGCVEVEDSKFCGSGLHEVVIKKGGPISIEWTIQVGGRPIDATAGDGYQASFQTAAWFVPLPKKETPPEIDQRPLPVELAVVEVIDDEETKDNEVRVSSTDVFPTEVAKEKSLVPFVSWSWTNTTLSRSTSENKSSNLTSKLEGDPIFWTSSWPLFGSLTRIFEIKTL